MRSAANILQEHGGSEADPIVAAYDYPDESGQVLFQKVRTAAKRFWQRRPNGNGNWINDTKGVRKLIYQLPQVVEAIGNDEIVVVVEDEKDADNLIKLGVRATCSPEAAKPGQKPKWRPEYSELLRDADVVVILDHDEPGRAHAQATAESLQGIARRVRVLDLAAHWPQCKEGGDVSDWLAAANKVETLWDVIERLPDRKPDASERNDKHDDEIKGGGAEPATEDAIALRFAEQHAGMLRYVAMWGWWLRYDGARWARDETLDVFDRARGVCREVAAAVGKSASAKIVAAVERLARADRRMAATTTQWDANDWLASTTAQTHNLRTGVGRAPDPCDYITKQTACACAAPGTPHPLWSAFLDRITGGDRELQGFLQRYCGYCCTGCTGEHVFVFFYGTGANGKSTFVSTVRGILGDYATIADMATFIDSHSEHHPTELAKLHGARMVVSQETKKGRRWDETKIKALTGGDKITARFMRQDFFDFEPKFKLLISGNHKPRLNTIDEAMRRRLLMVPFTVQIPKAERDGQLTEKLKAEWPAILRWMFDGCLEWQRVGLQPPAIVRDCTDQYFREQDTTQQWLDECTEDGGDLAFSRTAELFASWKAWCEARNTRPGSAQTLSETLAEHGFVKKRNNVGQQGFRNLVVKA